MGTEFRVVKGFGKVDYRSATETLSPEFREALLRAALHAGLQEDDPVFGILVAQAQLLSTVNSARSMAIKKLTAILASQQALLEKVAVTVTENSVRTCEHVNSTHRNFEKLREWIVESQERVQTKMRTDAERMREELQNQSAEIVDKLSYAQAASSVKEMKMALAIAYLIGLLTSLVLGPIMVWVRQLTGL